MHVDAGDRILSFLEKPRDPPAIPGRPDHALASMGIYVFEPDILPYVRGVGRIDLPDLVLRLVRERKKPMAFASKCQWLDIGRFDDYSSALEVFEKQRATFLPPAETLSRVEIPEKVR